MNTKNKIINSVKSNKILYSLLKPIWGFFNYYYRIFKLSSKIYFYDRSLPLGGLIGTSGWLELKLSNFNMSILEKACDDSKKVELDLSYIDTIREIFEAIDEPIRSYLGEDVALDGMRWYITTKESEKKFIASNWHTDNVGHRLKVFVCIDGDASQPTYYMPNTHKKTLSIWGLNTLIESLRWAGFSINNSFSGEIQLNHKTGTIFIFDTNGFHRGGWGNAKAIRKILLLEFSCKKKSSNLDGPIGTLAFNQFYFTDELLDVPTFAKFMDSDRILKIHDNKFLYLKP
jgi:hypothetical protein